ncbi:BSD domain containing protein [Nitzschia inconspicua]|uniref:BSD domain containing protein n=1 Tax=Nitzschia inconspicua TaxID=303405 RepID=A0A9K3PPD5_9STRA|nr:BSD domain containing protein [Nitzschia inconspicua]
MFRHIRTVATAEFESRRAAKETYTAPLDLKGGNAKEMSDFLFQHKRTFKKSDAETVLAGSILVRELHSYLVPDHVSEDDFWQRYAFRCNKVRIMKQLEMEDPALIRERAKSLDTNKSGHHKIRPSSSKVAVAAVAAADSRPTVASVASFKSLQLKATKMTTSSSKLEEDNKKVAYRAIKLKAASGHQSSSRISDKKNEPSYKNVQLKTTSDHALNTKRELKRAEPSYKNFKLKATSDHGAKESQRSSPQEPLYKCVQLKKPSRQETTSSTKSPNDTHQVMYKDVHLKQAKRVEQETKHSKIERSETTDNNENLAHASLSVGDVVHTMKANSSIAQFLPSMTTQKFQSATHNNPTKDSVNENSEVILLAKSISLQEKMKVYGAMKANMGPDSDDSTETRDRQNNIMKIDAALVNRDVPVADEISQEEYNAKKLEEGTNGSHQDDREPNGGSADSQVQLSELYRREENVLDQGAQTNKNTEMSSETNPADIDKDSVEDDKPAVEIGMQKEIFQSVNVDIAEPATKGDNSDTSTHSLKQHPGTDANEEQSSDQKVSTNKHVEQRNENAESDRSNHEGENDALSLQPVTLQLEQERNRSEVNPKEKVRMENHTPSVVENVEIMVSDDVGNQPESGTMLETLESETDATQDLDDDENSENYRSIETLKQLLHEEKQRLDREKKLLLERKMELDLEKQQLVDEERLVEARRLALKTEKQRVDEEERLVNEMRIALEHKKRGIILEKQKLKEEQARAYFSGLIVDADENTPKGIKRLQTELANAEICFAARTNTSCGPQEESTASGEATAESEVDHTPGLEGKEEATEVQVDYCSASDNVQDPPTNDTGTFTVSRSLATIETVCENQAQDSLQDNSSKEDEKNDPMKSDTASEEKNHDIESTIENIVHHSSEKKKHIYNEGVLPAADNSVEIGMHTTLEDDVVSESLAHTPFGGADLPEIDVNIADVDNAIFMAFPPLEADTPHENDVNTTGGDEVSRAFASMREDKSPSKEGRTGSFEKEKPEALPTHEISDDIVCPDAAEEHDDELSLPEVESDNEIAITNHEIVSLTEEKITPADEEPASVCHARLTDDCDKELWNSVHGDMKRASLEAEDTASEERKVNAADHKPIEKTDSDKDASDEDGVVDDHDHSAQQITATLNSPNVETLRNHETRYESTENQTEESVHDGKGKEKKGRSTSNKKKKRNLKSTPGDDGCESSQKEKSKKSKAKRFSEGNDKPLENETLSGILAKSEISQVTAVDHVDPPANLDLNSLETRNCSSVDTLSTAQATSIQQDTQSVMDKPKESECCKYHSPESVMTPLPVQDTEVEEAVTTLQSPLGQEKQSLPKKTSEGVAKNMMQPTDNTDKKPKNNSATAYENPKEYEELLVDWSSSQSCEIEDPIENHSHEGGAAVVAMPVEEPKSVNQSSMLSGVIKFAFGLSQKQSQNDLDSTQVDETTLKNYTKSSQDEDPEGFTGMQPNAPTEPTEINSSNVVTDIQLNITSGAGGKLASFLEGTFWKSSETINSVHPADTNTRSQHSFGQQSVEETLTSVANLGYTQTEAEENSECKTPSADALKTTSDVTGETVNDASEESSNNWNNNVNALEHLDIGSIVIPSTEPESDGLPLKQSTLPQNSKEAEKVDASEDVLRVNDSSFGDLKDATPPLQRKSSRINRDAKRAQILAKLKKLDALS